MPRLSVGSLFSGIGGFDLAAEWAGWYTAWHSEIDPYASAIMARHFPTVPNLGDITALYHPPAVDVLCGGFPCQDISAAGRGQGLRGARSGLWREYARIIGEIRPRWVVIENSPLLRTRGLGTVLTDLDAFGYDAQWHCIPAAAVGAPHQRDRIWVIAYSDAVCNRCDDRRNDSARRPLHGDPERDASTPLSDRTEPEFDLGTVGTVLSNALGARLERHARDAAHSEEPRWLDQEPYGPIGPEGVCYRGYTPGWWTTEPNVGRVAHGIPNRVDRIRCLGNAVVPVIPWLIFQAINDVESLALD